MERFGVESCRYEEVVSQQCLELEEAYKVPTRVNNRKELKPFAITVRVKSREGKG